MPVASILFAAMLAYGEASPNPPGPSEVRDLTLPDAIRTALDNSENIRVVRVMISALGGHAFEIRDYDPRRFSPGQRYPEHPEGPAASAVPVLIARLHADDDLEQFRADATALVLSVEEQYWTLWRQSALCRTREAALEMAREGVEGEDAVRERLEGFRREFESAVAGRDEAESRLRRTLGLAPSDRRRLVPSTAPRTDEFKPDGEGSLSLRRRALDLPAAYHELRAATEARAAASALLAEASAGHPAGRVTTRDYLDALDRWCLGVAEEGRACVRYNRALALLDQDRGMVLDAANIAVAEGPKPRRPYPRPLSTSAADR